MRVAYVINSVEGGGAALPVPSIVDVLRRAGAEVRVLALTWRDGRAFAAMKSAGLDVSVRAGGETDHLAAILWLDAELDVMRATHVWTSLTRATLLGQLAGWRRGLPVVSWQHAAYLKPANAFLLRALQSRSAFWVADSSSVADLSARRLGIPRSRLMTWPIFAADRDAPTGAPLRPGQTVRIGSLGRLHPVKGYDVLVSALALLAANGFSPPQPFEVSVAGDGDEAARLLAQARDAGVQNLRLVGYAERPSDYLAGLHAYVQPSRSEGFCIAAHEAMAAGLPVVGSAVGEMARTIRGGIDGWTVAPGDPAALAAALRDVLSSPERIAGMGRDARQRVLETFSRERFETIGRAIVERLGGQSAAR